MKIIRFIFCILITTFCSSCGTVQNHAYDYDGQHIVLYGGVRVDYAMGTCRELGCGPQWFLDMPFSLVFDTLCLPRDVYYVYYTEGYEAKKYQEFLKHAPPIRPDPLAGWKHIDWKKVNNPPLDEAVIEDYKEYIQKIPPRERFDASPDNKYIVEIFEDSVGGHAVKITLPYDGVRWEHDLIYDQSNKRIKTIKYAAGYYRK